MKFLKKRGIAVLICIIAVIGSILVSARRDVNEVKDQFTHGVNGDGYSIYNDLQKCAALAHNLSSVAERNLGEDNSDAAKLDAYADELNGEQDPAKAYKLYQDIGSMMELISIELKNSALSKSDKEYYEGIMVDFASCKSSINHDGYNDNVRELNEKLSKFPGNIIAKLAFAGEIKPFN